MHIKEYNGIEFKFSGPDLHEDDILSVMDFLNQQIEEIDNYPDKSLFFQNPKIYDSWLLLVGTICKLERWSIPEDNSKWEELTETYVAYLLTLREYYLKYQSLYLAYFGKLKSLLEVYGGWQQGLCISDEAMEMLSIEKELIDSENVNLSLSELNSNSLDTRHSVFTTLSNLFDFLSAIMDNGLMKLMDLKPSIDDFAKAIDDDLREWTHNFGKGIFQQMKEDLNRHFKDYRTAPYTPELWGQLLDADENALNMAKRHELASCEDVKQEHWGEDRKSEMDENSKLMHQIYTSCRTEELFELGKAENVEPFIEYLTPDNLPMFYDIIVRRNLIQCEMYPELKAQHNEWLNPAKIDKTETPDGLHTQEDSEVEKNNEESAEEERFHFIHPEIEDEEALRIHKAIKRLVATYSIPDICKFLKEKKQKGKLLLPSDSSAVYKELVRLGMPTGKGFSEKNFSNSYTK